MKTVMILVIVCILFGVSSLHYVDEQTRLLRVVDGDAQGLLGPGWVFVMPGSALLQPLSLGDTGTYLGNERAEFAGQAMPVKSSGITAGSGIYVAAFQDDTVWVQAAAASSAPSPASSSTDGSPAPAR